MGINQENQNCLFCGKLLTKRQLYVGNKYCSMKCSQKSQVGSKKSNTIKKVKVVCKQCGKIEFIYPSQAKTWKSCSRKCMGLLQRGKEHPERQKRVKLICQHCGKEYDRIQSHVEGSKYCSPNCMFEDFEYRNRLSLGIKKAYKEKNKVGFTGLNHTEETIRICRIKAIQRFQERGNIQPAYNPIACEYFNAFDCLFQTQGQYALNGGEFYVEELGYFLDYINHHLELIIEYDERRHYDYQGNLKKKDITRQKEIQDRFPDYEFIRINEMELKRFQERDVIPLGKRFQIQ